MILSIRRPNTSVRKTVSSFVAFAFLLLTVAPPGYSQQVVLPAPGQMVLLSSAFEPPVLKGLTVHLENPFLFDFIVDRGQDKINAEQLRSESTKLVKFFLAALTIPDQESWVNLSPAESDRVIPNSLGSTEMGKVMLEQDYILKQLAASLTNPQTELGKKYWQEVDRRLQKDGLLFEVGADPQRSVSISDLNAVTKVWIVPDGATVAEHNGSVFITNSKLKVMMQEEYAAMEGSHITGVLTMTKSQQGLTRSDLSLSATTINPSAAVFRELILPKLIDEVNTGKNFAPTRQVYQSVVLAAWYKQALKESLLGKVYVDKAKVLGVDIQDRDFKSKVYEQYLAALKKGVYNIITEEPLAGSDEALPRKYFSGGLGFGKERVNLAKVTGSGAATAIADASRGLTGRASSATFQLTEMGEEQRIIASSDTRELDAFPSTRYPMTERGQIDEGAIGKRMMPNTAIPAVSSIDDFPSTRYPMNERGQMALGGLGKRMMPTENTGISGNLRGRLPPGVNAARPGFLPSDEVILNEFNKVIELHYGIKIQSRGGNWFYVIYDKSKAGAYLSALAALRFSQVNNQPIQQIEIGLNKATKEMLRPLIQANAKESNMADVNLDVPAVNDPINDLIFRLRQSVERNQLASSAVSPNLENLTDEQKLAISTALQEAGVDSDVAADIVNGHLDPEEVENGYRVAGVIPPDITGILNAMARPSSRKERKSFPEILKLTETKAQELIAAIIAANRINFMFLKAPERDRMSAVLQGVLFQMYSQVFSFVHPVSIDDAVKGGVNGDTLTTFIVSNPDEFPSFTDEQVRETLVKLGFSQDRSDLTKYVANREMSDRLTVALNEFVAASSGLTEDSQGPGSYSLNIKGKTITVSGNIIDAEYGSEPLTAETDVTRLIDYIQSLDKTTDITHIVKADIFPGQVVFDEGSRTLFVPEPSLDLVYVELAVTKQLFFRKLAASSSVQKTTLVGETALKDVPVGYQSDVEVRIGENHLLRFHLEGAGARVQLFGPRLENFRQTTWDIMTGDRIYVGTQDPPALNIKRILLRGKNGYPRLNEDLGLTRSPEFYISLGKIFKTDPLGRQELDTTRVSLTIENIKSQEPLEVSYQELSAPTSATIQGDGAKSSSAAVGGINFDPTLLDLQIKRDNNGVPLPLPDQNIESIDIKGLFPVMINIQPINNIPAFLGMDGSSGPADQLASG